MSAVLSIARPRRTVQIWISNTASTSKIYTLSLHDALPISQRLRHDAERQRAVAAGAGGVRRRETHRPRDLPHRSAIDARGRHVPGAARHGLPRHATYVVRTADRPHRPAVHRPDVPLRLDDG